MRTVTSHPRMHADQRGWLVELKSGNDVDPTWEKPRLNYLRATEIEVGLLLNFGPNGQFKRYAFENDRKKPRYPRESAEKKSAGRPG